jgi:hypothetical protein
VARVLEDGSLVEGFDEACGPEFARPTAPAVRRMSKPTRPKTPIAARWSGHALPGGQLKRHEEAARTSVPDGPDRSPSSQSELGVGPGLWIVSAIRLIDSSVPEPDLSSEERRVPAAAKRGA